jgi:hypothetical protein
VGSISASARSEQTATDTTDGIQIAHNTSLTFAPPPAASAGISANPATVPADGQTAATIIVTLKDSLNRPSPGKTIAVTDAGAHAVITGPTPSVTDANGQIQFSATDQVNETVTFTATDVSDHLPIPGSGTVTYSGSTATACNINVAPVGGTGYSVTTYITGFPAAATFYYGGANIGCPGANNPTFTPSGSVLVSDFLTGAIYQSPLSGGTITSANVLNTLTPALGYEFTPRAGLELAYTYRDANAAQLHGNIASVANLTPLLRDTTEMLRDYGNIVSLSYSGHFDRRAALHDRATVWVVSSGLPRTPP